MRGVVGLKWLDSLDHGWVIAPLWLSENRVNIKSSSSIGPSDGVPFTICRIATPTMKSIMHVVSINQCWRRGPIDLSRATAGLYCMAEVYSDTSQSVAWLSQLDATRHFKVDQHVKDSHSSLSCRTNGQSSKTPCNAATIWIGQHTLSSSCV